MGARIKDLGPADRPRERLWALGPRALADRELLAILVSTGCGESALDLASRVLAERGGLTGLSQASPEELACLPGLGPAKTAILVVVVLDAGNRVWWVEPVTTGAVDKTLVPVREILNLVLRHDGAAFAVAHNHPAGDLRPSAEDANATVRLAEAAPLVGLTMLDHLIIADGQWLSLREEGYVS